MEKIKQYKGCLLNIIIMVVNHVHECAMSCVLATSKTTVGFSGNPCTTPGNRLPKSISISKLSLETNLGRVESLNAFNSAICSHISVE